MIAADPSNPQWVGLALRRPLGLPLPSGLAVVSHISGYLPAIVGSSGRTPTAWMPEIAWVLPNMSASLCLEGG